MRAGRSCPRGCGAPASGERVWGWDGGPGDARSRGGGTQVRGAGLAAGLGGIRLGARVRARTRRGRRAEPVLSLQARGAHP